MARFHIFGLRIGDWLDGAHLERLFQHNENGDISVKDAVIKASAFTDKLLRNWDLYKPILVPLVSDDFEDSAEKIEAEIRLIQSDLLTVETLPDAGEVLENYPLAKDPRRNTFYHELINNILLSAKNGNFSPFELGSIGAQIAVFVKVGE